MFENASIPFHFPPPVRPSRLQQQQQPVASAIGSHHLSRAPSPSQQHLGSAPSNRCPIRRIGSSQGGRRRGPLIDPILGPSPRSGCGRPRATRRRPPPHSEPPIVFRPPRSIVGPIEGRQRGIRSSRPDLARGPSSSGRRARAREICRIGEFVEPVCQISRRASWVSHRAADRSLPAAASGRPGQCSAAMKC